MHRRTPSHFPRIGAFCPLAVRDAWLLGAQATPPIPTNHVRIHYFCPDGNHLGLTVYAFGDTTEDTSNFNRGPVKVTGQDSFGAYFDLDSTSAAQNVAIIIHKGNVKDPGPNDFLDPAMQNKYLQLRAETTAYHSTAHDPVIRPTDSREHGAHHYFGPDANYASWTVTLLVTLRRTPAISMAPTSDGTSISSWSSTPRSTRRAAP